MADGGKKITKAFYDFKNLNDLQIPRLFSRSQKDNYAPAGKTYRLPVEDIIELSDNGWYQASHRKVNPQVYREYLTKLIDY